MTEWHDCVEASIGWFEAHGWVLVKKYRDHGVDMALMRHDDNLKEKPHEN